MRFLRGPRYNQDCPFPIVPNDPLSAEKAVRRVERSETHRCQFKKIIDGFPIVGGGGLFTFQT